VGRNTAPAIALAALLAVKNGDDPILLVLAADHLIENKTAFSHAIDKAHSLAENQYAKIYYATGDCGSICTRS
jgi:mannose-1-phosphate guanylyltransferase